MKGVIFVLEVKKQGTSPRGVWVIGTLDMGGLVIESIFNTNLKSELPDTTQPIKVKKVKISRNRDNTIRFDLEF